MLIVIFNILFWILVAIVILWLCPLLYVYKTHKVVEICFPFWPNLYFFYYIGFVPDTTFIKTEIGIIEA